MLTRCTNPNVWNYKYYGGRGIAVCDRWLHSFENFRADMGDAPDGLTIDRIATDGSYEPGNCRWLASDEQKRNRRMCVRITFDGETLILSEWARRVGVHRQTLQRRIAAGWPLDRALSK
jgi:hypothetical protein